jgi:hypothetical protein
MDFLEMSGNGGWLDRVATGNADEDVMQGSKVE